MMDINDSFEFKGLISSDEYLYLICDTPRLGLFLLSVRDAAELVASDFWFEGKISIDIGDTEDYDPRDPLLLKALSQYSNNFEKQLAEAINKGSLKATKILRNFKEEIDLDKTLIEESDLMNWLSERGHKPGEAINHYYEKEGRLSEELMYEIYNHRMLQKTDRVATEHLSETQKNPEGASNEELRLELENLTKRYTELLTQQMILIDKHKKTLEGKLEKKEKPLSTRVRRTLLTIIAALCSKAGIDYKHRGASKRISEITNEIGANVTDETIRKIIDDIDDAVETRMK